MIAIMRNAAKRIVRGLALFGIVWPFVLYFARRIGGVDDAESGTRKTLLFLQPNRFRGEIELLRATRQFRILTVPFAEQTRLLSLFYEKTEMGRDLFYVSKPEGTERAQKDFRRFLRMFLPRLYARLGVHAVLGAGIHYWRDLDWGAVSNELGYPLITMHRENLLTTETYYRHFCSLARTLGKYTGSAILVQNEMVKQAFSQSGFIESEKVFAVGAMRMDDFVAKLDESACTAAGKRKKLVFFSFSPGVGMFWQGTNLWPKERSKGMFDFFENTHIALGELARDNPDIDVVIKPKWDLDWKEAIEAALNSAGMSLAALPNLTVSAALNPHQLILEADIVSAFGSTTMLEAAVTGKPVIIPFFNEASEPQNLPNIQLYQHFGLFDVANSPAEYKALLQERLERPEISHDVMAARRALFELYVSPLSGSATDATISTLSHVVASRGVHL